MKTSLKLIGIIAVIGLAFFSCKEEGSPPQEHSGTITAFGKTINVKGDASILKANFDTAKGKLQEAMSDLSENVTTGRDKFVTMLERTGFVITIVTGDDGPNADANKSMTIGVNYLLANDKMTIVTAISTKVAGNAFAGD